MKKNKLQLTIILAAAIAFIFLLSLYTFAQLSRKGGTDLNNSDPEKKELKKILTEEQYYVTVDNGTESPFKNAYWNNKKKGLYVDVISGDPLFISKDKFNSGTGWPSFTQPVDKNNIIKKTDKTLGMSRTEVRSKQSNAHLGHVFDDGPAPSGKRYCINSAALRFIPFEKLNEEGYSEYTGLFNDRNSKEAEHSGSKETAVFAAGCFWGVEAAFQSLPGVISTAAGFMGGTKSDPTYEQVCTMDTGHAEVVQITYDPNKISYSDLVDTFFKIHNPTTLNRQGPDFGSQYRSAIFYYNQSQKETAIKTKERLNRTDKFKGRIVTEITKAAEFYRAEEYHQKYLQKQGKGSCKF